MSINIKPYTPFPPPPPPPPPFTHPLSLSILSLHKTQSHCTFTYNNVKHTFVCNLRYTYMYCIVLDKHNFVDVSFLYYILCSNQNRESKYYVLILCLYVL